MRPIDLLTGEASALQDRIERARRRRAEAEADVARDTAEIAECEVLLAETMAAANMRPPSPRGPVSGAVVSVVILRSDGTTMLPVAGGVLPLSCEVAP